MRAVQFDQYGGPVVLHLSDVAEPHAGPGQVRIRVRAAGVNGIDWKTRAGYMQRMRPIPLPAGTGVDASGVVDQIGEGVTDVAVGDPVFGSGSATWAEYAVLTAWAIKPQELSFEEAAGYPLPVETALRILDEVGVQPGQTLLVSGAAGGVGSAVVQFARQRNITVLATASAGNQGHLRALGAEPLVYGEGLVERVQALAANGVDAALDIAGHGVVPALIELTGDPSRVLSIGDFRAGELGAKVSVKPVDPAGASAQAARLFEHGAFHLPVARTFPLDQAAAAQEASEAGHVAGRFIVSV